MAAEAADTVTVARAIFNNMGVAFPGGTCQEILLTLMSGDYMGWGECTYAQAQEFANAGAAKLLRRSKNTLIQKLLIAFMS